MIKYNGEVDKKFNDFAERYADVITVTKKRTPQEPDLSGVLYKVIAVGDYGFCPYVEDVNDYRLPDIGHNKDYFDKKKFMLSTQLCDFFSTFPHKSADKAGCAR